ncbi:bacillithiol biosynthesis deacetylase BshB2 [Paenibacillus sp. HB172176]|uniref:bacillithiol biosynthesis deacetylase BshB2 n=1 Tax=Paenibacillus sp. HB172176 TaxID=2493690 RepID=UPI00143B67A6|nr:bacillithiol biosynthesis deacetylase BshB2 [Paenibacillus sp. HB172176]
MDQKILVILPHPDDEAFGISGILAKSIAEGAHVTYACLTLGEMGRNMGVPPFANRITLPEIRKKELEESCRIIGIQDLRLLGFHDKTIEFEDQELLDEKINSLIEEIEPSLIITFYPGYSVHPDHDATGEAVVRTVGRLPRSKRPPVHCIAFAKDHEAAIGKPTILYDVADYLEQKIGSIRAHRSQFQVPGLSEAGISKELKERFGVERFWVYPFS